MGRADSRPVFMCSEKWREGKISALHYQ